jgi:hypothetical protein
MNQIIIAARTLFILIALGLILVAGYVLVNRSIVNGSNALAVLGAAIASIGVIASWHKSEPPA